MSPIMDMQRVPREAVTITETTTPSEAASLRNDTQSDLRMQTPQDRVLSRIALSAVAYRMSQMLISPQDATTRPGPGTTMRRIEDLPCQGEMRCDDERATDHR